MINGIYIEPVKPKAEQNTLSTTNKHRLHIRVEELRGSYRSCLDIFTSNLAGLLKNDKNVLNGRIDYLA